VTVADPVLDYIARIVEASRASPDVMLGASPRAGVHLLRASKAAAAVDGRDFVTPDDVKELAYATLGHRLIVSPAARVKETSAADIVNGCLQRVPVPGARPGRPVRGQPS